MYIFLFIECLWDITFSKNNRILAMNVNIILTYVILSLASTQVEIENREASFAVVTWLWAWRGRAGNLHRVSTNYHSVAGGGRCSAETAGDQPERAHKVPQQVRERGGDSGWRKWRAHRAGSAAVPRVKSINNSSRQQDNKTGMTEYNRGEGGFAIFPHATAFSVVSFWDFITLGPVFIK